MSCAWWLSNVIAYSAQVACLAAAGAALAALLRLRSPGVMHAYWRALLAVCLLLPALQSWRPPAASTATAGAAGAGRVEGVIEVVVTASSSGATLALAFGLGVAARLLWLALGLVRLGRYRRRARLLEGGPAAVTEMQTRLGVRPRVYVSDEIGGPATFGLWSPTLLLPERFLAMAAAMQRAIACHELLHVRRRDWTFTLLEELVRAFFWFHPAVWWLVGKIRLTREQVVDRQVLQVTGARRPYLEALLEVASAGRRSRVAPAPLFLQKHHLARRVELILKEAPMSRLRLTVSLVIACGILLLAGRLAVASFPLSASTSPASLAAALSLPEQDGADGGGGREQRLKAIHKVNPTYPAEAKEKGIEGQVTALITINQEGKVTDAEVESGPEPLRQAALDAVREFRFANAAGGPFKARITFNFVLGKKEAAPARESGTAPEGMSEVKIVHQVAPVYPDEAQEKGVEGKVVVRLTVNEKGEVINDRVLEGHELLHDAALAAARQWRFSNPTQQKITVEVTLNFQLEL